MPTEALPGILQRLAAQDAPASHLRRIEALRELCERCAGCVGLALVGSYARNQGDRISDLDLVAFFADGSAGAFP